MRVGGDIEAVKALTAAGAQPGFGTIWLGPWTTHTNGKVQALADFIYLCKANNVEPHVQFFMAGDQISEAFFDGTVTTSRGANLGKWWELVKAIGTTLGQTPAIITLEPEWFKKTLEDGAPKFDAAWANAAYTIRGLAPNAKIVNCPGEWAPGTTVKSLYPKMVAATDIWGVQNLRCLTRNAQPKYESGPLDLLARLKDYAATFPGKRLIVTDLAYSTYGGAFAKTHPFQGGSLSAADHLQKTALENIAALVPEFASLGVTDIIIRSLRDVNMDDIGNWFGAGEDGWGIVRGDGSPKPGHAALFALATTTPPTATYTQAQWDEVVSQIDAAQDATQNALLERDAAIATRNKLSDRLTRIQAILREGVQ